VVSRLSVSKVLGKNLAMTTLQDDDSKPLATGTPGFLLQSADVAYAHACFTTPFGYAALQCQGLNREHNDVKGT
jgi:hypothetical protein